MLVIVGDLEPVAGSTQRLAAPMCDAHLEQSGAAIRVGNGQALAEGALAKLRGILLEEHVGRVRVGLA